MSVRRLFRPLPSSVAEWRHLGRTVLDVLSVPWYAILAVAVALGALTIFTVSLNPIVVHLALMGTLPASVRLEVLSRLYPFVGPGVGTHVGVLLVVTATLFGIDVALITSHLRGHGGSAAAGGGGSIRAALGAFGAAAASCAVAMLSGATLLYGDPTVIVLLPFAGLEFTLLALVALLVSIYWATEAIGAGT
jgi:hypothetical protein